jgi:hypothetical protein
MDVKFIMTIINRYLESIIKDELPHKMVFLGGPRQVGKTFLAKILLQENFPKKEDYQARYLNWDFDDDKQKILKANFPSQEGLLVFDEIHKYLRWRNLIKGFYDKKRDDYQFLITGSARLDVYRRGGDSLQGRYSYFRLYPFSVKELSLQTEKDLLDLLCFGGFPEIWMRGSEKVTKTWTRQYRTRFLREDVRDLEKINEISLLEGLVMRLPELVASPLSLNSLRNDLQVAHKTVERWLDILERMYSIFRVLPFGTPKLRAIKKSFKHYHYNWTEVADPGARFENLVALHLIKHCHFIEDRDGEEMELRYFRDVTGKEVDFVILKNKKPELFLEVKLSATMVSPDLIYLKERFPKVQAIQIGLNIKDDFINREGIRVMPAIRFLSEFLEC